MSQIGWIYLDDYGQQYKVGLYHGTRSGNVIIHCNNKILVIDFNVLKSKTYSFYLSDDLVEIELCRKDDHFEYDFHINTTADTPKNRLRAKRNRKERIYIAIFFLVFLCCIAFIYYLIQNL